MFHYVLFNEYPSLIFHDFFIYGRVAFQSISYAAKMLPAKILPAKILNMFSIMHGTLFIHLLKMMLFNTYEVVC